MGHQRKRYRKQITNADINNLNDCYENEWESFIEDAKKKGFNDKQISENPIVLLHLFYLWIGKSHY